MFCRVRHYVHLDTEIPRSPPRSPHWSSVEFCFLAWYIETTFQVIVFHHVVFGITWSQRYLELFSAFLGCVCYVTGVFYLLNQLIMQEAFCVCTQTFFYMANVYEMCLVIECFFCIVCVVVLPQNRKTQPSSVAQPHSHPVGRQTCYFWILEFTVPRDVFTVFPYLSEVRFWPQPC